MGICAFRLDDITPDMNWNHFNRICGIFDKYDVKPLLGVVPDNQDSTLHMEEYRQDFWERMRYLQEKGYSISQHGFQHLYETKSSGLLGINPFSEFAGLSYEKQYEKIRKGKEILQKQGICVTIFMAPGHTFDKNTLKALKANDFEYVTDGYASRCYRYKELVFVPSRQSRPAIKDGIDTICLHVNHMKEDDFSQLEQFLKKSRNQVVEFRQLLDLSAVYRGCIFVEEKKNLWVLKIKHFISTNEILHTYLQETTDGNSKTKRKKRILGIPRLIFRLVRKRN